VVGYDHPVYGQSGLEASLDSYLRGLQGNPASLVWWNDLVYGLPPDGLDVRLSLDLGLQQSVDLQLGDHNSALVLMNARDGDILAMASHPTFNPNQLDQDWSSLVKDPHTPLLDRAVLGQYQPGAALGVFLLTSATARGNLPALPQHLWYEYQGKTLDCAVTPAANTWQAIIAAGCPAAATTLGMSLEKSGSNSSDALLALYKDLGLYSAPAIRLQVSSSLFPEKTGDPVGAALGQADLSISPLQMARAAAVLSSDGVLPAPKLAISVKTPQAGWVILPDLSQPVRIFPAGIAGRTADSMAAADLPIWQEVSRVSAGTGQGTTWYIAGTLSNWNGSPLVLALLLEEDNPSLAEEIGQAVMKAALSLNQ
jgi:penicillin-binding protein A